MNTEKIAKNTRNILELMGEDVTREGLKETPMRSAKAWKKICGGYSKSVSDVITIFDAEQFDEMIIVRDIEFYSTCEHHLLPFFGKATIGYIPNKKIIGLSKIPRIVEIFSRRLQNQERLTGQLADAISRAVRPKGVGVLLSAKHMCMMARGIEKQCSFVQTSSLKGSFKNDPRTRSEFLDLSRS